MLRNLLIVLSVAALALSVQAQQHQRKNGNQQQRAELRSWFETTVFPSLKKWHDEYDASLSSEDLATLVQLRSEAKALKQRIKAESKEDRSEMRDDMKALLERVKPIAKRSRETLRRIFDANEDQIEAWREELREKLEGMQGDGKHRRGGGPMNGMLDMDKKSALRFILWDGTMPPEREEKVRGTSSLGEVNLAPNPADHSVNISMQDLPNGKANIEIFDMNGVKVGSHQATVSNGTISERVDISSLTAGNYMVSVVTQHGRKTTALSVPR